VRAMQLWSSWNADVAELGARHNAARNPSYEHLVVHTEDLIDAETKFEAVRGVKQGKKKNKGRLRVIFK